MASLKSGFALKHFRIRLFTSSISINKIDRIKQKVQMKHREIHSNKTLMFGVNSKRILVISESNAPLKYGIFAKNAVE